MHTFKSFLSLLENMEERLGKQNPTVPMETIRHYATHDKSPTKKFLPWLVKQHKLGNVTPDHPDLASTIGNFDKYKTKHGIANHTEHTFQEVADAVKPHIGTAATNKELQKQQNNTGVELVHKEPNGITAQHIKTKAASQNMYGGGADRGGEPGGARGTAWCVSARSTECRFQNPEYGKMYTVHDPSDDRAPYAVHPEINKITSRFNDGDKPTTTFLKEKPHLATAVNQIKQHYISNLPEQDQILHKFKNERENISEDDLDKYIKHPIDHVRYAATKHPKLTSKHIDYVLSHENEKTDQYGDIRSEVAKHPSFNADHITHILTHENNKSDEFGHVRSDALIYNQDKITDHHIQLAKNSDHKRITKIGNIMKPSISTK